MKYLFANFKLNPIPSHHYYPQAYRSTAKTTVAVFPPTVLIDECIGDGVTVGAQCGSGNDFGAFTGEVNMKLLKQAGCSYVLCGHSERRKFHNETNASVASQVIAALNADLQPVICIGETEQERKLNITEEVLTVQLAEIPLNNTCIIAYEPVWAIGTGDTATSAQIAAVHAFLRQFLAKKQCDAVPLLYGGSMNSINCKDILTTKGVDGGLIGGASLKPEEFANMVAISEAL